MWIKEDLEFWFKSEEEVAKQFELFWRQVIPTEWNDVLDFKIVDKNWNEVWLELKTRRANKDDYEDTMIWINKIIEAYKRYNDNWIYTIFAFKFYDWLFIVNPFLVLPRFDYKRGRFDRGNLDKVKAWAYYKREDLKKIIW